MERTVNWLKHVIHQTKHALIKRCAMCDICSCREMAADTRTVKTPASKMSVNGRFEMQGRRGQPWESQPLENSHSNPAVPSGASTRPLGTS